MKEKLLPLFIASFVFLVCVNNVSSLEIEFNNLSFNQTFYVDDDEPDGGDGSIDSPFNKIQDAIDVAGDGDIIKVKYGVYSENLFIYKQLTIEGTGDSAYITGGGENTCIIKIEGTNNVKISGFKIKDGQSSGIGIVNSNNCEIFENSIYNNNGAGIFIESRSSNNKIYKNIDKGDMKGISGNGLSGILITSSSNNLIYENDIKENVHGIHLSEGEGNKIFQNNIKDNNINIYFQSNSKNNNVYKNNFYLKSIPGNPDNNFKNAYISSSTPNTWSENYWSDYRDEFNGPGSPESSDKVHWNEPYYVDPYTSSGNIDYRPWVHEDGKRISKSRFLFELNIIEIFEKILNFLNIPNFF